MSFVEKVVAQFARPTGFWGDIAGFIMAYRPSNLARNEWAISLLNLQPSDRVLEIGFEQPPAADGLQRQVSASVGRLESALTVPSSDGQQV